MALEAAGTRAAIHLVIMTTNAANETGYETAMTMATLPPPDDYEHALQRERLDAAILRALGERRALRSIRTSGKSSWDSLERQVARASTVLWEVGAVRSPIANELLAFCAYLARELEVTESLDLDFDGEWERLQSIAPTALGALDEITNEAIMSGPNAVVEYLLCAFDGIRAELEAACRIAWALAG